jgi:hypothetical protein
MKIHFTQRRTKHMGVDKGARVWVQDEIVGWRAGEIIAVNDDGIQVNLTFIFFQSRRFFPLFPALLSTKKGPLSLQISPHFPHPLIFFVMIAGKPGDIDR